MESVEKPGWHTRGYLPHFDPNTRLQHVIFRTNGALPAHILLQVGSVPPDLQRNLIDAALDASMLGHVFSDPTCAQIMENALLHCDGDRYDLKAWCIMPNHVHVVFVTAPDVLLGRIVKSWKHHVARQINHLKGESGAIFAKDYFDRFVRNLSQAQKAIHYVEANPVKANLVREASQYQWSSAFWRANGWSPRQGRLPLFLE